MDPRGYTAEHFELMAQVASWLPGVRAELQEHTYAYFSFGSWWFTFLRAGRMYRVVYDGKESDLRLESGKSAPHSQWIATWEQIELVRFEELPAGDDLQRAIRSLIERLT